MPDKIKEVYELISDKGYFTDENEFRTFVKDPKTRKDAFELIKDDGIFADENEFNSYFDEPVKKKDSLEPVGGGDGVLGAAKKAAEARVASPSSPQQPKPIGTSVKSAATGLGSALPSPLKSESESGKEISGEATLASPIQPMSGEEADAVLKRMQLGMTPGGSIPKEGQKTAKETIEESGGKVAPQYQTLTEKALKPQLTTEAGKRAALTDRYEQLKRDMEPELKRMEQIGGMEKQLEMTNSMITELSEQAELTPESIEKLSGLEQRRADLEEKIKFEKMTAEDRMKALTTSEAISYMQAGGDRILQGVSNMVKGPGVLMSSDNDVVEGLSWAIMPPAKLAWEIFKPEGATAKDNPMYQLGTLIDDWRKEHSHISPLVEDKFSFQLVKALSGDLPMYGLTGAYGGPVGVSAMGAFDNGVGEYEAARKKTFDANEMTLPEFIAAYSNEDGSNTDAVTKTYEALKGKNPEDVGSKMFLLAGAVGTLEGLPFVNWLSKFDKRTGGVVTKYFEKKGISAFVESFEKNPLNPFVSGIEEASQEALSEYLTNVSANKVYDASRELTAGLDDAAGVGFGMGFLLGMLKTGTANLQTRLADAKSKEERADIERSLALLSQYEQMLNSKGVVDEGPVAVAAKAKVDKIEDKLAKGGLTPIEVSALTEAKESAEKEYEAARASTFDKISAEGMVSQLEDKAAAVSDVDPQQAADFMKEAERLKAEIVPEAEPSVASPENVEEIVVGEATLPVQENAPDVASPVNSAPPVVEQTTVDDGGVTAPVVSLTETAEVLATSPENVALKDVESTAKALEGVKFNANFNLPLEQIKSPKQVSEAYHKAKVDGSNSELVKAVEELLGEATVAETVSSPDATVPVQEVSEPVTEAAPKVASPARETKLQKRVREARERIQAKKTASEKKAELETIRAERAESRAKKEQISKLRTRTPKNVADGGKIGEDAFRKEVMDNDAEVKNRKGRIIANAKDISDNPNTDFNDLNTISMRIAEDMQVPAEIYDETVDEIMGELIIMSLSIQNRNDAEASLTESYERELMQAEMSEAEFAEYEAEQKFLKGEARLDDYYSEDQLNEMSDAQKMADAVSIMEQTGSIPANTPTRRDKIKSEIDKIKDDIRKMSSGRLSSLPVDLFPKYVQLAAKYMELYGYDAYQFLAALKADGTDMGLPDDYLLSAHDKAVSEMKTSKFARTVQNAGKGISEKTKSEFSETGSTYTPITVRDTAKTAFEAWNEILERNNGDLEAAVWEAEQIVLRDDWGASPEQIGVLAGIVAEKMNELSKVEGLTIEQKNGYELRATNVFVKVRQRLTKAGQEASVVGKFMKEYFMAYPEAVTSFVYTSIDERNDTLVGVPGTEFTGTMMEIISEIMSTEAGMNAMMQLGIGKQGKIKKKYDKKQKAVSDAFDRVINDIDSFASGVSFAVPIPPSVIKTALKAMKKAIVSGLEVAKAVEIAVNSVKSEMKGVSFDADKAKAWFTGIADTILTDAEKNSDPEYVLSKMQEKLIKEQAAKVERAKKALEKYEAAKIEREEKERIAKEAKAAEKAAKDAERQAKKEAADEAKAVEKAAKDAERLANAQRRKADAELERYNSALNNLKGNKLRQFAFNLAKNLPNGSGVINESMIVRAFQQANGGFQLTAKQQAELHQLAQVIANAYQSNRNALSASPNNSQFINSWIQAQYNAAQAAAKISQMLNPKRWVDMVNNAIVMNFMTFKTLGANPISNAIHKLYSAAYDDLLFSFVDVLYAPGQKSTFRERFKALFNIKPTVSWAKQLPDSVKRAWDIMKEGSPVEDTDRYGASYTMKPLEAWQNISARASATNGFLPKVNSIAKDVYEGTFGVVPAFISRSLSSGDIVFRDPEAARVYQKWADDLGVDIDEFLTSEEFSEYRYYALEYAKRITFQQENVVSKVAGKAISKVRGKEVVDWLKVLFVKPVIPFFGTPINIKHEMLTMIPPISFSESLHHASVAKNKKLSDAERFFHAKLSQKMMRRAVGSIPLYYAASALLASGIISIIPGAIGDDDDAKERLNREAFEGKSGRVKIKNRNATIDGLKFGPLFDYLILVDAVNREYDRTGDEFNVILKGLVSTTKSTIDNTYLQGLKNVMEAATDPERNLQSLLINTYGSAYANILFPNIMSDLTRMMDKEKVLRQTKDESFVKSLYNKVIRERIGFIKSDYTDIEQLPSRVNVLGEPIRTDRDGVMDIFHYMFDMSRAQVYEPEKKAQLQIYKNFLKTDDKAWLYPIAPARVKFESESVKLDPVLRNEYQRILGQTLSKALGKKNLKSLDLKAFEKMKLKAQEESAKSFVEKYGDRLSELKKKQAEEKKRNPERDILK